MKKYIIIIISTIILAATILGVYLYCKPTDIELSKNDETNAVSPESNKEDIDLSPVVEEEMPVEEKQVENSEIIDTPSTDKKDDIKTEQSTPSTTVKKDSSTINTNKSTPKAETTKKESEIPKQENTSDTEVDTTKTEPIQETPKEDVKEEPTQKQEVIRCTTNDNHFMGVGNSGKWFSTKTEAIQYYEDKIVYWDNWWQNTNSPEDDATYYKNCPYGYEVWSCMYCSKWTINFYYR